MKRWLVVLVAAAVWPVLGMTGVLAASGAAANGTNYCPFTFNNSQAGPDPDFVSLLGPAVIPAGATTPVGVYASESEAAANTVALQVMVQSSKGASTSAASSGKHNTTTTVKLAGQAGVTYTLSWFVTFDGGVHPCASALPGYHAFTVTTG